MRASDAHHHLSSSNIILYEQLASQFGEKNDAGTYANDVVGKRYTELLDELTCIAEYQWRSGEPRGLVKGFLLSGPPGTGKTTIAKRLALELGNRFAQQDQPPVVMAFVDGGEISRSRYGESEERIRDIFVHAHSGFTAAGQRSVLLFDDIESVFMARGNQNAKEWHFSQDSVLFHSIDNLDTSRTIVVLTSNRPDLIDEAIRDRFLSYVIDYPDTDTLMQVVANIKEMKALPAAQLESFKTELLAAVRDGTVRSIRDAQRFAVRQFVANVLKRESLAQHAS
jgi:SpoVK/Ycf46/Vps4 family AAA+-type ATPase